MTALATHDMVEERNRAKIRTMRPVKYISKDIPPLQHYKIEKMVPAVDSDRTTNENVMKSKESKARSVTN